MAGRTPRTAATPVVGGTAVNAPAVCVSLRKPPPLDVPLLRRREDDGSVSPLSDDDVIATAGAAAVRAHAPPGPTVEEAETGQRFALAAVAPPSDRAAGPTGAERQVWYADEILISEGDLIGKTREQLSSLHFRRDRDWLQS